MFIANGDLSGDVTIRIPKPEVVDADPTRTNFFADECYSVDIPGEDLLSFVANHIRNTRIRKLESMTDEEILNS